MILYYLKYSTEVVFLLCFVFCFFLLIFCSAAYTRQDHAVNFFDVSGTLAYTNFGGDYFFIPDS